jgi:hypothetical protein
VSIAFVLLFSSYVDTGSRNDVKRARGKVGRAREEQGEKERCNGNRLLASPAAVFEETREE